MSIPTWRDVLPNCGALASMSEAELTVVANLAESEGVTVEFGISAIGHLMAIAASSNQLSQETAASIGWLLMSLGTLSSGLADMGRGVDNELLRRNPAQQAAA